MSFASKKEEEERGLCHLLKCSPIYHEEVMLVFRCGFAKETQLTQTWTLMHFFENSESSNPWAAFFVACSSKLNLAAISTRVRYTVFCFYQLLD